MGNTTHLTMERHTDHTNMKTNTTHHYGWRRQLPDKRDELYEHPAHEPASAVDLRGEYMPDIYNQGALGSCTANAIAAAFQFCEAKQGYKKECFTPSRLFIY